MSSTAAKEVKARKSAAKAHDPHHKPMVEQAKKVKILVVEDEGLVARDIENMVRNLGYDVSDVVSSGEEAVEQVRKLKPDLVLMDIFLRGDLDGVQAAELIRRSFKIPVIFLTAHTDDNTFDRAKVTDPFGYAHKPVEQKELMTIIEMALYKHRMEMKVRESEEWLSTILSNVADGVIATDREGCAAFMNPAAENLVGFRREAVTGRPLAEVLNLFCEETGKKIDIPAQEIMAGTEWLPEFGTIFIQRHEERIPIEINATFIGNDRGETTGTILVLRDITERKRHEEQLRYLAIHDPLTGLPNRSLFYDRLELALAHSKRSKQKLAVLMLDLDFFKKINDTFGHAMGDKVLQGVAGRLKSLLRESDTVARFGGDEFVLLLPEIRDEEDALHVARRMHEAFHTPFLFDGQEILITTSIGIAISPEDGESIDALTKNSDRAMYRAKETGRDKYEFYLFLDEKKTSRRHQ